MSKPLPSPFMAVLRKELLDTLRDRRTLIAMIVVPMLVFPVLMVGMARYTQSVAEKARSKVLTIAVADPNHDTGLADHLDAQPGIEVIPDRDVTSLSARIAAEELDAAVLVTDDDFAAGREDAAQQLLLRVPLSVERLRHAKEASQGGGW